MVEKEKMKVAKMGGKPGLLALNIYYYYQTEVQVPYLRRQGETAWQDERDIVHLSRDVAW